MIVSTSLVGDYFKGDDRHKFMGIQGAFISVVSPEGPSKKAGLQEGDVILKFNKIGISGQIPKPLDFNSSSLNALLFPIT